MHVKASTETTPDKQIKEYWRLEKVRDQLVAMLTGKNIDN